MTPLADAVVALVIVGTPPTLLTLWMLLLNRRDRRRAAIAVTAGGCCRALGLSGMVALDVSTGVWTRRARVTLDMRLCAAADIWRLVDPGSIDLLSPRRAHAVIGLDQRRRVLLSPRPEIDGRVLDGPGHWAIYEAPERANATLFDALSVVP